MLSTCNRSEIYVASADPTRARRADRFSRATTTSSARGVSAASVPHEDTTAAHHLFRVAAGLDSLVLGEPQILGQVKDAFQAAAERRCTGPLLSKTFHWAFGVGKRVRTETALGEGAVSVSFAAVALARKIFGRLEGRRVLVVGAGEISALTAQHLRSQGAAEIVITNRTAAARRRAGAARSAGRAVPWTRHAAARSPLADIVVTATGSQRPIITRADVEAATGRRRTDPLFIIDVAVPRDVDPAVGEIEQVFLYNVDDLQGIVQENLARRGAEIARAEAIVARRAGAVHVVASLAPGHSDRRRAPAAVRRHPACRVAAPRGQIRRACRPEARARIDEVTRLIVEKLLLEPTEQLKALPDEETQAAYTEAVNRLFSSAKTQRRRRRRRRVVTLHETAKRLTARLFVVR